MLDYPHMVEPVFDKYVATFLEHGYSLYMVGGSARDYLLMRPSHDYDFATDATPEEMRRFLPDADYSFSKYGSVKLYEGKIEVDITTLREEGPYNDSRHPSYVHFVKDPYKDFPRRDFTINALYITKDGKLLDYVGGEEDLVNKLIRFIGDPRARVEEDPLRILRAERFARQLDFQIEAETLRAIRDLQPLLNRINPEKIRMEMKKLQELDNR